MLLPEASTVDDADEADQAASEKQQRGGPGNRLADDGGRQE